VEWLKVKALSSSPVLQKTKKPLRRRTRFVGNFQIKRGKIHKKYEAKLNHHAYGCMFR
jgi:hypothetical protein